MTTHAGPTIESTEGIGALTLGGFLDEVVARFGPNEAVVLDDPLLGDETVRWSYDQLGQTAHRVARALIANGVQPGETVGILMGNRPEALASIFGTALAGAVAAPMSTFSTRSELAHMVTISGTRVVLTQSDLRGRSFADDLEAIAAQGQEPHDQEPPSLQPQGEKAQASQPQGQPPQDGEPRAQTSHRQESRPLEANGAQELQTVVLGEDSWTRFLASGDALGESALAERIAATTEDDPALIIFSSGTTSKPKAMLHTNRAPALQAWVQAQVFHRSEDTRMFSALPIFWTAGLNTAVGATLATGGCWVTQEVFQPSAALDLLARERVTEPYTLPHQTAALAELDAWVDADLSALRSVYGKGAYARHPSVTPDPNWVMPVGWGMSETCAFICAHPSDTPRERAKVGHGALLPGTLLRVLDPDTGEALGTGEEGELCVAGATLMLGYLGRAPESCFDADGFFHTGDTGHVDPDGNVHYSGRLTEMIKTGGANVSPAEVEVALRACPPVKLSRVIGVPDARLDEIVVACIVVREGSTATQDEIQAFLRGQLAAYKVPKHVLFFDQSEMPMTGTDAKVRDDALMELVRTRLDPATTVSTEGES